VKDLPVGVEKVVSKAFGGKSVDRATSRDDLIGNNGCRIFER
jgi:hypothetical protein